MFEPFKINRVLPPHELNARRDRKRVGNNLPALVHSPAGAPRATTRSKVSPTTTSSTLGANPFTQHD